jgi:hypothetical protein
MHRCVSSPCPSEEWLGLAKLANKNGGVMEGVSRIRKGLQEPPILILLLLEMGRKEI